MWKKKANLRGRQARSSYRGEAPRRGERWGATAAAGRWEHACARRGGSRIKEVGGIFKGDSLSTRVVGGGCGWDLKGGGYGKWEEEGERMTAKGRGLEGECNDRRVANRREQVNAPIPRFQRLTGPLTDPRYASVTAASAAPPAAAADFVMSARDNPTGASLPLSRSCLLRFSAPTSSPSSDSLPLAKL